MVGKNVWRRRRRRDFRSLLLLLWLGWMGQAMAATGPIVDLDAADLPAGELANWQNRGTLGGSFTAGPSTRTMVATFAERKALSFGEHRRLKSTFNAPQTITGDRPFTLAVWACTSRLAAKEVMVSWASRPWDSAEFGYGGGTEGAFCNYGSGNIVFRPKPPPVDAWHHIAFVYRPGAFQIWVDGEVSLERAMPLKTKANEPVYLGTAWDFKKNEACFPYHGALSRVLLYDRALAPREVRNLSGRFEAFQPSPPDASTLDETRLQLAWQAGAPEIASFDIFLGKERAAVNAADRSSQLHLGSQSADKTTFGPLPVVLGQTCYWRVDQSDASGQVKSRGPVWQFTVSAGPATEPQPRDQVAGVKRAVRQLTWTPGKYAVSQNVYFGTDRQAVAAGTAPAIKALPETAKSSAISVPALEYGRTCFWRVEQNNGALPSSPGTTWSFRVEDETVPNDLTFFVGSDCHYGQGENDTLNRQVIDMMNWLPGTPLPEEIGGGIVRTPRGVILNGDLLDNGSDPKTAPQVWPQFLRDYGLSGEGRLAFPLYAGFGHHDGGPDNSVVRTRIRDRNRLQADLAMVSENGFHYSWNWDPVHLVQLNLFAGADENDVASVSPRGHDPADTLGFLKATLEKNVGRSNRPVIIFQHIGWPPDGMSHWWSDQAKERFFQVVKDYNVVLLVHGHSRAATIYQWKGLEVIADGSTARPECPPGDFFVVRLTSDELMAAHRTPQGWGVRLRRPLARQTPAAASNK